jgi:hypothetical protein
MLRRAFPSSGGLDELLSIAADLTCFLVQVQVLDERIERLYKAKEPVGELGSRFHRIREKCKAIPND